MNLIAASNNPIASLLDRVAINPQPLPPGGGEKLSNIASSAFDKVALNPQPLPPKSLWSAQSPFQSGLSRLADEFCGTHPPRPHGWPGTNVTFPNLGVMRGPVQLAG